MPTNQSSPWGGASLRACCNSESPTTATSASAHAKTVASNKVPLGQTSLELSKRKDQARTSPSSVATSAFPLRQTTVTPSVLTTWENCDGNETRTQRQFTSVPDGFPNLPQQFDCLQIPNKMLLAVLKQGDSSHIETNPGFSLPKKDCLDGFNNQLQRNASIPTSQPENGLGMGRRQAPEGYALQGLEPFMSNYHEDLLSEGKPTHQQKNNVLVGADINHCVVAETPDCSPMRSLPPPCLNLCEHQGATLGKHASSLDSTTLEIRSTTRETANSRRCHSAKPATKSGQMQNNCTAITSSNSQLMVRGSSLLRARPKTVASLDGNRKTPKSQCRPGSTLSRLRRFGSSAARPVAHGSMSTVCSANEEKQLTPQDVIPGNLVGCVTNQISAIHLTKQRQPATPFSSPSSSISSPSLTDECLVGESQLSGPESCMQVDGVEEELPDELENACSDDDDSDSSSINGTSSKASLLSAIEEPMSLETEDDREVRPALVPSLFPFIPPTLYFSTANEKVELLPAEQRRLLKWKMSTVTPNVVKHIIDRSHFKVTKKSHDWLGCWGHHMKSPGFKAIEEHQKLNHFPGTFQIGRKDRLWRNLSKMQVRFGKQEFSFFPRTFVLPQDIKLLRKAWEDSGSRQKWIIKPPASARGIGIQVIHKWSQMPRKRPLLVQKYLHKPYLISGNKFDLRIYVYVTSYDPLRIYIFSDGLVRFASCKYSSSMKTLSNKFMHLTNYSVNKKNSEYQSNSDDKACQGHKWALKALWQYLGCRGINTNLIWEKIKDIVIKTIIASEPYVNSLLKMHVRNSYSCHELFGFDIMLDENLKPWILEVNISPSLHSNTGLDVAIKGQMIRDVLNLAGFHIPQKDDVVASCSSASSSTSSLSGGRRERSKADLSADEKVKRAFYLTQRNADQDLLCTVLDVLTPDDVRVLAETEDEMNRKGEFERIFPSATSSRYLRFFECPRYLNILLDHWEQKYWKHRTKGISLLRSLCQEGVHLGTTDPAHKWSKCSYGSKVEPHKHELCSPSKSRVVVSHQHRSHHEDDEEEGSDKEVALVSSLPLSLSPGSSVTTSACASPQPSLTHSLLPQQFASL